METPDMDSGKKDLASLYPEIAAQWDPEKNGEIDPLLFSLDLGHLGLDLTIKILDSVRIVDRLYLLQAFCGTHPVQHIS